MIKVTASNYVKENCTDKYLALVKEIVEKTNANDPGCIKYEMCRDVNDPQHFVMLEEWESQEALDNHMKAPHFIEIIPKMGEFCAGPAEIAILSKVY